MGVLCSVYLVKLQLSCQIQDFNKTVFDLLSIGFCCEQDLRQAKDHELSAVKEEMKQQTEKINTLTQELIAIKASQEQLTKEKESLQVTQLTLVLL